MNKRIIVMGTSAGGLHALHTVLAPIPSDFPLPIAVVQHLHPDADDYLVRSLSEECHLVVKYPENGESPYPGVVYVAPANRHLRISEGPLCMLSDDAHVNHSRPSIDALFLSAAETCGAATIGVVLTGGNDDGALGLRQIKARGGLAIVQAPKTAEAPIMPNAAIAAVQVDHIVRLEQIGPLLWDILRPLRCGPDRGDS